MIAIIDFGMGNLGSIHNMLTRMNYDSEIVSNPERIRLATKLILPGVGAFDTAMTNLENRGLLPVLNELVMERKIPLLGICLGMQLLCQRSEEGRLRGLGWIDADVVRFAFSPDQNLRIPHMGWNTVRLVKDSVLFKDMYPEPRFYFVHSYYVKCKNQDTVLAQTQYGREFASAIMSDNIYGVQFHPEKSHKFGMKVLANYAELC